MLSSGLLWCSIRVETMTAEKRKKHSNSDACTSREQYNRVNKKKVQVQQHKLDRRPNISLEWDDNKKNVVSKRNQIGIARRLFIPFFEPSLHGSSSLADVISVPQEIFNLEDLREVLTYEVWQGNLSGRERKFLSQFLPKESEPELTETTVRNLLAGENFHFGNPFSKWSASLCLGKLHPDDVLLEEQHLKTVKKEYYSHLQKYHHDMIETLQTWKNKWVSCKDSGLDIVQNIWSCREHAGQIIVPSETGFYCPQENLSATPESCSLINSEVAYSSDNQNYEMKHEESRRRKDSFNKISDYSNEPKGTAVPRKQEKIRTHSIQNADGTKYMSYIKVSKEQHERVKGCMRHAGNSIQSRSLDNVLGSIDTLNVQPFERFEEEERKNLHNHWLKLATKEIPEGFINWEKGKFQRQELRRSLGDELGQKIKEQLVCQDMKKQGLQNNRMRLSNDIEEEILPSVANEGVEKEQVDDLLQGRIDEEAIHEIKTETKEEKEMETDNIFDRQIHNHKNIIEDDNVQDQILIQGRNEKQIASASNNPRSIVVTPLSPGLLQDQHHQMQPISSLDCNPHSDSMDMESQCGNSCAETNVNPQYPRNLNHVDIPINQGDLLPSTCDVWPVSGVRASYYQSTTSNMGYQSSQVLPIGHQQFIQGQEVRMHDLENNSRGKDAGNEVLHRQPEDISYFSSYSNQDQNGLLQSFFKGQSNMPYHQQPKHSGLELQPSNDLMMEAGQFSALREKVHLSLQLDPRQKRLNNLYMNQSIQENIYSGGHFAMPRQEELPVNVHDWASINKAYMPVSCQPQSQTQPHMTSGDQSQNWCTGENGTRDGWPSFEIAVGVSRSLGSGSNTDQTLFSVISECNELRPPQSSYESVCSTERLVQGGNYSGIPIPLSSNFLQQAPNRMNYMSGHEGNGGIKMNNLGWIGIQQNSGMQESRGVKPILRSWNQQG